MISAYSASASGSRRREVIESVVRLSLEISAEACRLCGDECEQHAPQHEHGRIYADVRRQCDAACGAAARVITPTVQ